MGSANTYVLGPHGSGSTGTLRFAVGATADSAPQWNNVARSTTTMDKLYDGQWHMVTATYTNRNLKLYVDGALQSQSTLSGSSGTVRSNGINPDGINSYGAAGNGGLNGVNMDGVIYSRNALSAAEVQDLFVKGGATIAHHDRGMVVMPSQNSTSQLYLGWRLYMDDPSGIGFNIYRRVNGQAPVKLTSTPRTQTTDFVDATPLAGGGTLSTISYFVTPVIGGVEGQPSRSAALPGPTSQPYLKIPFSLETGAGKFGMADFQGRGQLDFTVKYPGTNLDPQFTLDDPETEEDESSGNWVPAPGTYKIDAIANNGTKLWTYDMGWAIEMGTWYSPYCLYDLDQDGKAELIVKAGDKSMPSAQMRDEAGRVVYGPEYVKVVSGVDGSTVMGQGDWPSRADMGDYNRTSRNYIGIAYLDGVRPHVVAIRGTYGKIKVAAYIYSSGTLTQVDYWENQDPYEYAHNSPTYLERHKWWGQAAHSFRAADIDNDGKEELLIGAMALDHDLSPLWTRDRGHVDHAHIGDLAPDLPGLEIYYGTERTHSRDGMGMWAASSGNYIWSSPFKTVHVHETGLVADLDAAHPGSECYSGQSAMNAFWLWNAQGYLLAQNNLGGLSPFAAYWDADRQKELFQLDGDADNLELGKLLNFPEMTTSDTIYLDTGTREDWRHNAGIIAIVDIVGDWRE